MGVDPESIGSGAGGGLLGALLAWLGFKDRLNRMEAKIDDCMTKQECRVRHSEFKAYVQEMKQDIKEDIRQLSDEVKEVKELIKNDCGR